MRGEETVLGVLLWLHLVITVARATCPWQCQCVQEFYVYCDNRSITDQDLRSILDAVPISVSFLDLSHNRIEVVQNSQFLRFSHLQDLNLANNSIHDINSGSFQGLNRLEKLHLQENSISKLYDGVFSDLETLVHLQLNSNNITMIDDSVFGNLRNLKELYLENNGLAKITDSLFRGLGNLKHLDLSHNLLEQIQGGSFEETSALKVLNVRHNLLSQLDYHTFAGLSSLSRLLIDNNKLEALNKFALDNMRSKIEFLSASFNRISNIENDMFHNMGRLRHLNLSYNELSSLGITLFAGLQLRELSLQGNRISRVNRETFNGAHRISNLNLADNQISVYDTGALDSFRETLVVLDLNSNLLGSLRYSMFRKMSALQLLSMSRNNITVIEDGTFADLERLEILDISKNRLKTFSSSLVEPLGLLNRIYLYCNPLVSLPGSWEGRSLTVVVNLTVTNIGHSSVQLTWPSSVQLTWPYREQRYWSLYVYCVHSNSCSFTSQPKYLPAYSKSVLVKELLPLSQYYICVMPNFVSDEFNLEQCCLITTPEYLFPSPTETITQPLTSSASIHSSKLTFVRVLSCLLHLIFYTALYWSPR